MLHNQVYGSHMSWLLRVGMICCPCLSSMRQHDLTALYVLAIGNRQTLKWPRGSLRARMPEDWFSRPRREQASQWHFVSVIREKQSFPSMPLSLLTAIRKGEVHKAFSTAMLCGELSCVFFFSPEASTQAFTVQLCCISPYQSRS